MSYKLIVKSPSELTDNDKSSWHDLETRCLEPNAFMSPNFVLPAIKYLENNSKILFFMLYSFRGSTPELSALAIFKSRNLSKYFPLPHLESFMSTHSYLSNILLDRTNAIDATSHLFKAIKKMGNSHGIFFSLLPADSAQFDLIDDISKSMSINFCEYSFSNRPIYKAECHSKNSHNGLSKNTRKNYKRRYRRLCELGDVEWNFLRGINLKEKNLDKFIDLENKGWKSENKSSLASSNRDADFFKEMMMGFSNENNTFMTELNLNGKTISSTSNLISCDVGFAFKIGWDPSYAQNSPGILNELKLIENYDKHLSDLRYIDSGTDENSYINQIWLEKRKLVTGIYALTPSGQLLSQMLSTSLKAKKYIKNKIHILSRD